MGESASLPFRYFSIPHYVSPILRTVSDRYYILVIIVQMAHMIDSTHRRKSSLFIHLVSLANSTVFFSLTWTEMDYSWEGLLVASRCR